MQHMILEHMPHMYHTYIIAQDTPNKTDISNAVDIVSPPNNMICIWLCSMNVMRVVSYNDSKLNY